LVARVSLPRYSPELLRYNARLVVLNSYWLFVVPLVASQLILFWYMAMKSLFQDNAAFVARTTETAAPIFAAFLCAHVLAPEYRHRLGDIVFSRPVPFARTVLARLATMYVFLVALVGAMLLVYRIGLHAQYDLTAVVLAGLPSVFFLSMLALAVAAVWHSPVTGFAAAAVVWAGDAILGAALNPLLTLHAYSNRLAEATTGDDLLASKALLCLGGAVLAWIAARAVGRPVGPVKWRALARASVAVVCLLLVYVGSGAVYKVQQLSALEADREALPGLRMAHQRAFAAYGRLPVAYLFGPAYADYIGYPVRRDVVDYERLKGRQQKVDQLRAVVFSRPGSRWADNAFYELIHVAAQVVDDKMAPQTGVEGELINRQTALQYCHQFLRDYPRSPFGPLVAERMLALAQALGDEAQMRTAYELLVTTYAADPLANQTAQKMMTYYAERGRTEEAAAAAETALKAMASGGDPEALIGIGDFLRSLGRTDVAGRAYRQALLAARAAKAAVPVAENADDPAVFEQIRARGKVRRAEKQAEEKLRAIGLTP
jgi:tetratricopeptide (TPR) repeat protein/ABC-type transport system involved in multi-copper enzyme maturation permease subunit